MLGHFETKTPSTNRTSLCWGTTSRPRHRHQIVHLSAGAPLRDQDTGNKSYILVLGHHFETKTPATNRTCLCWGTTSRSRHRQRIVHLSAGAPLRDQDTGNKSYISVLGHHFETKTPATKRTSSCWGTTSKPRHRQQIVHLRAGAPLPRHRQQNRTSQCWGTTSRQRHRNHTGNKSYILVLGHHFETKTPATEQTPATNRAGAPLRDQVTRNKLYI